MATVIVSGLPRAEKKEKLIAVFNSQFRKNGVHQKFWITASSDLPNSKLKEITLKFSNEEHSFVGAEILNNFKYHYLSDTYNISAHVDAESFNSRAISPETSENIRGSRSPNRRRRSPLQRESKRHERSPIRRERRRDERQHSRNRYKSSSPHRESCELDMQLELLRKQRMLIEEERRLLLERKKLELVQEYGVSASRDFKDLDRRRSRPSFSPPRKRTRSRIHRERPSPRKETNTEQRPSQEFKIKKSQTRIPKFMMPCKYLLKDMAPFILKYSDATNKKTLEVLLQFKIRTRITVLIAPIKKFLNSKEICQLYRDTHPIETDEEFVEMASKSVAESHLPELQNKNETKSLEVPNNEPNWFIDTAGDGSVANMKNDKAEEITEQAQNNADANSDEFDLELEEDYDLNDVEDWNTEEPDDNLQPDQAAGGN